MFSWLNFEELLIHNPIELINPSKDTISVAMNKKQYIEFFSNKYTYNGVYYDEEMDFCLFYYADPLQSYKEGDVYAQGYIDVEMKIYRVKWLCNVSIKLPLAPETTGIGSDTILWAAGHKWEYGSTAAPYMPSESETTKSDRPSYIGQYTDYTLEDSTNPSSYTWREIQEDKLNVSKTEMVVNAKNKTITTVLNGALAKCTKDKDITGWLNSQPNTNYNYRQPQYSLDIGADDFIISGFGLRGLKNG